MTNKQVIEKLQKYFLEQDRETVARGYANALIDINRYLNIDKLPNDEKDHLIMRSNITINEIKKLMEDGENSVLKLKHAPFQGIKE